MNQTFGQKIVTAIEKLVLLLLKPSFLTWIFVTLGCYKKWLPEINGMEYLLFTACIIGIKSYEAIKRGG